MQADLQRILPKLAEFEGRFSVEILAEQVNESRMQIQRYIRLTNLIPPLMEAVDAGKLKFVPAADYISHLTEKEQTYLQFLMERDEVSPSVNQAQRLKQISAEGKLENNIIDLIMREEKPLERKVTIRSDRLQRYFPASYTPKQMEEVILKLLGGWRPQTAAGASKMRRKQMRRMNCPIPAFLRCPPPGSLSYLNTACVATTARSGTPGIAQKTVISQTAITGGAALRIFRKLP